MSRASVPLASSRSATPRGRGGRRGWRPARNTRNTPRKRASNARLRARNRGLVVAEPWEEKALSFHGCCGCCDTTRGARSGRHYQAAAHGGCGRRPRCRPVCPSRREWAWCARDARRDPSSASARAEQSRLRGAEWGGSSRMPGRAVRAASTRWVQTKFSPRGG